MRPKRIAFTEIETLIVRLCQRGWTVLLSFQNRGHLQRNWRVKFGHTTRAMCPPKAFGSTGVSRRMTSCSSRTPGAMNVSLIPGAILKTIRWAESPTILHCGHTTGFGYRR